MGRTIEQKYLEGKTVIGFYTFYKQIRFVLINEKKNEIKIDSDLNQK